MDALQRWVRHSSPLVKATMALAITSGVVVTYRMFYGPYVRRRRLEQAEEWANSLIEQEERIKQYDKSV